MIPLWIVSLHDIHPPPLYFFHVWRKKKDPILYRNSVSTAAKSPAPPLCFSDITLKGGVTWTCNFVCIVYFCFLPVKCAPEWTLFCVYCALGGRGLCQSKTAFLFCFCFVFFCCFKTRLYTSRIQGPQSTAVGKAVVLNWGVASLQSGAFLSGFIKRLSVVVRAVHNMMV